MTARAAGPRFVVLCEYSSSFAAEPILERLEICELSGPIYSLAVQQFASPDGESAEAWISAEVTEIDALRPLLDDWSSTRRIAAPTLAAARRALALEFPARASRPDDDRGGAAGQPAAAKQASGAPPVPAAAAQPGYGVAAGGPLRHRGGE